MVRLVFRPYSHVGRTICTSVSLQASTRVSPGFAMHTNRSPSFGSHHECCRSSASEEAPAGGASPLGGFPPLPFVPPRGLRRPGTRIHVRLLGPCFKTGRA